MFRLFIFQAIPVYTAISGIYLYIYIHLCFRDIFDVFYCETNTVKTPIPYGRFIFIVFCLVMYIYISYITITMYIHRISIQTSGEIQLIQETSRQKNHSLALYPTQNTNIMNQSPGILLFTENSWQMDIPTVPQKYGVS